MKKLRKITAALAAAMLTLSMGATCFAGEWKDTDEGKMYCDDNGKAATGITEIDGETYCFSSKGIMQKGWLTDKNGSRFYFGSDGAMYKGWLKTKGGRYYLTKNGSAATGVKKIGDSYYCFNDKGRMLTGWQEKDGETYYYEANGKRAVNKTLKIDGVRYRFGKTGSIVSTPEASSEDKEKEKEVIYPTEISPMAEEIPLRLYSRSYITFNFTPKNTTYKNVTYKSSNTDIVEIDKYGEMYAKKKGTCYITVTSEYKSTVSFTVKVKVTES